MIQYKGYDSKPFSQKNSDQLYFRYNIDGDTYARNTKKIYCAPAFGTNSVFQLSKTGKYATMSNWSLSSTWNPSTTSTTNFVDSSRNKLAQSSGNGILVTTGTSEKNKVMNIYDLAGNVIEWTLENTSDTVCPCATRGGYFMLTGSDNPAAYRDDMCTNDSRHTFIGFRVSLFQEKLNARDEKFETRGKNKNYNRKL